MPPKKPVNPLAINPREEWWQRHAATCAALRKEGRLNEELAMVSFLMHAPKAVAEATVAKTKKAAAQISNN